MFQVTINGKIENYEAGTPYLTIAQETSGGISTGYYPGIRQWKTDGIV